MSADAKAATTSPQPPPEDPAETRLEVGLPGGGQPPQLRPTALFIEATAYNMFVVQTFLTLQRQFPL